MHYDLSIYNFWEVRFEEEKVKRRTRNFAYSTHKPGFGALGIEDFDFGPTGLTKSIPANNFCWSFDNTKNLGQLELSKKKASLLRYH